jgi:hypothetical protein
MPRRYQGTRRVIFGRARGAPMIACSGSSMSESAAVADDIGVLSVVNAPAGVTYTFAITSDPDTMFQLNVDGITLEVEGDPDYATQTSHDVEITATGSDASEIIRTLTIQVTSADAVYDADALAAFAAMSVAPDATRKGHLNTLIAGLKTDGDWADILLFGLHAMHDEQAARVDLKTPARVATKPGGDPTFVADDGFTSNGSSTYLDWGVTAAALLSLDDHGMFTWSLTDLNNSGRDVGSSANHYIIGRLSGDMSARPSSTTTGTQVTANSLGFYGYSRSGAAAVDFYKNGAPISTESVTSAALPSSNIMTCRAGTTYSTRQLALTLLTNDLDDAGVLRVYNRLRTYMTAVGVP